MTVLDSDQMDIAVATVAVHAFAAANLQTMMPRGKMLAPEAPQPPSSMQAMLQQLEEGASLTALFTGVVRVFVQMRLGCSFTKLNPIRHSCSTIVHQGRLRTWLNTEQAGALVGMGLGCCLKKTKAETTASPDEMKRMLQDE